MNWDLFENNQKDKISIEHIYPQSPKDKYWTDRFVTDGDKALTHSLGNLLLLSVAKNSGEQNYSFEKKKKTERNEKGEVTHNGYDTGSYSEIYVSQKEDWTPKRIIDRGKELLTFFLEHWKIDYTFSEEEINKLLNISSDSYTASEALTLAEDPDWAKSVEEGEILANQ